jgi:hypothetical protein
MHNLSAILENRPESNNKEIEIFFSCEREMPVASIYSWIIIYIIINIITYNYIIYCNFIMND